MALTLISCENDTVQTNSNSKNGPIQLIYVYKSNNIITNDTSSIYYNGNKIDYIIQKNGKIEYEYLSKEVYEKNFRAGDAIPWQYIKYNYDENGKIAKVLYYININSSFQGWTGPKIDSYRVYYTYEYDYLLNGTVKEKYFNDSTSTNPDYIILTFDINGNVTVKDYYSYQVDCYMLGKVDSLEYDGKNHYFKYIDVPTFGSLSTKESNISKIKTLSYTYSWSPNEGHKYIDTTSTVSTFNLKYNDNDFPISIESNNNSLRIEY
jgi:hypothetical protein